MGLSRQPRVVTIYTLPNPWRRCPSTNRKVQSPTTLNAGHLAGVEDADVAGSKGRP